MDKSYYKYWGKARREGDEDGDAYHLLAYHSLDVAAVGQVLLNQNRPLLHHLSQLTGLEEKQFKHWAIFFLALHDIGKFSDSFQNIIPELLKQLQHRSSDCEYATRHDSLGFLLWRRKLKRVFVTLGIMPAFSKRRKSKQQQVITHWMSAVTGHHGEPPKTLNQVLSLDFNEDSDFDAVTKYVEDIYILLCEGEVFPSDNIEKLELASWWLSGFAVLCDWLGSNKNSFPYYAKEISLADYWQISLSQAEKAILKTGLLTPKPTKTLSLEKIINAQGNEKIEPTPLQKMAQEIQLHDSSHLFILEDVTGAGKTEAAVILAHRLMQKDTVNGVYFALPTMATANAMYSRLAKAYLHFYEKGSRPSLILAHAASALSDQFSQSILPENNQPEENYGDETTPAGAHCNQWLADNRKKALLADIGVGTIDQALLAILPSRHQSLRLLGLLDKVLIIDEVHACDAYMQELLCALLRAHAASGGSALLLSATLPENQRQKFVDAYNQGQNWQTLTIQKTAQNDYPLVTALSKQGIQEEVVSTRVSVKRSVNIQLLHQLKAIEDLFSEVVANRQCACWIRNTVIDARESFEYLKKKHPDWKIDLFHARFTMGDRLAIENRVLERFGKNSTSEQRQGQILIATQVVEQSLDADWDELVTDLVPIDMIIQRAGRLRRHSRDKAGNRDSKEQRGQAVLHILSPKLIKNIENNWYADFFPKAKSIYPNHGQLWLTASLLQQQGKFQMPEDARTLIEGVYGENAIDNIPQALQNSEWEADGESRAEASLAKSNALKLDASYSDDAANLWWDEARTPTRLGEDSITLYLARWQNGKLKPWNNREKHAWSYSSVTARTYWVAQEKLNSDIPLEIIEACKEKLPAKGKWGVLISLVDKGNDCWEGSALNEEGEEVTVRYTNTSGLVVE